MVISRDRGELAYVDAATGTKEPLHGDPGHVVGVIGTGNRKTLLISNSNGIYVWHTERPGEATAVSLPGQVLPGFVACSPDGKMVAMLLRRGPPEILGKLLLWDVATQKEVARLDGYLGHPGIGFFPDGRTLATTNRDTVQLWDLPSRQVRLTLTLPSKAEIAPVAISPDGRWLVTAAADEHTTLWDSTTGQAQARVRNPGYMFDWFFSPDGSKLALAAAPYPSWADEFIQRLPLPQALRTAQRKRTVIVFDAATGAEYTRVPCGNGFHLHFVDDRALASLSWDEDAIELWDLPPRGVVHPSVAWAFLAIALLLTRAWWSAQRRCFANGGCCSR